MGCTTKKREIKGCIQEKNGWLYVCVYLYINGKRKPRMINTGLPVKGYHKREAKEKKEIALQMLNGGATLEMVKDEIEGAAFKKVPKPTPIAPMPKPKVDFIKAEIFEEFMERGEEFPPPWDAIIYREKGNTLRGSRGRDGSTMQVADYFRNWIVNYRTQVRESSWISYSEQIYNRVIPYFSQFNITLTELCSYDISMFYKYCFAAGRLDGKKGNVSSSTINRVHSYFSKGLSDATRERLIPNNPARDADIPKNNEFTLDPYTEEELEMIVEAAIGDACEFPILMGCSFGLRRSEACGLRERVFDFKNSSMHINHTVTNGSKGKRLIQEDKTKNDSSNRVLPLEPAHAEYVQLRIARNAALRAEFGPTWNPEGYLSVWDDGTLIAPNTVTRHLQRIAARLNLPVKRFHDVRHSVLTILMKHNVNMRKIQGIAGHSDIKTTERYAHFNISDLITGTQTMNKAIPLNQAIENLASNM